MVSNRNLLFQGSIFRCYVSFREGPSYSCSWRGSCISQNSAETNLSFTNRSVKSYSVTRGGLTLVILCCIWFKQRDFRKGLDRSLRTILRDLSLIMQFLRALAAVVLGVMASLSLQGCGSEEESVVVTGDSSTNTTMTATMTMTTTVTTLQAWAWQTVWAGSRFRRGPEQVEKQGMPACQVPKCRVCMMLWNLTTFHLSFAIFFHLWDWALASLLGMLPCHKCTCTTNPWPSGHSTTIPFAFSTDDADASWIEHEQSIWQKYQKVFMSGCWTRRAWLHSLPFLFSLPVWVTFWFCNNRPVTSFTTVSWSQIPLQRSQHEMC